MEANKKSDTPSLSERYAQLREQNPGIRARDAAQQLFVSECELVASRIGAGVTRLVDDPVEILKSVKALGDVMALTRNDACVHERHGVYDNAQFPKMGDQTTGLLVNPDIDLRLFLKHWAFAFAVTEESHIGPRRSVQFFDPQGTAVHKIYLTEHSNIEAYDALVARLVHAEQLATVSVERSSTPPKNDSRDDSEVDWAAFRGAWENLKDTHDFFPMLRKFKVGREQAFRRVGSHFAYEIEPSSARLTLELARDRHCEIMVFVGNRGAIQIHTGHVEKLAAYGPWFNVLDPKFNLHLREDAISRIWVTRKPTSDGYVTAVEIFDENSEIIATFFGKRKPGQPELELWREIVGQLPTKAEVGVA